MAGNLIEADIVDLTHDARGVARVDGKAVFVDGALPGERARFRVYKRRGSHDEAVLESIVTPSPQRVDPLCRYFGVCGGCSLQHLSPQGQVEVKQAQLLETLARVGGVKPARVLPALQGSAWGYRRRARLGVRFVRKKGRVLAGFREREKPYIADIARCEILQSPFEDLPARLAALVETLELREQTPQVEFSAGDSAVALIFRILAPAGAGDREKLREFGRANAVVVYLQTGGLDTIVPLDPPAPKLAYLLDAPIGSAERSAPAIEAASNIEIEFAPQSFIQVNAAVNAAMVRQAIDQLSLQPGDRVLDLFCGLGNFTLPLARAVTALATPVGGSEAHTAAGGGHVVGVEGDAPLIAGARANAAANGIGNAEFHVANLFEPKDFGPWADSRYHAVLLDPPRAGAREVVERMSRWGARKVVYISCHSGSLARDAGILVQTQGFELTAAGVMDMFPHTTHIEAIAVFERTT